MKSIKDAKTLQEAANEFYQALRTAMIDYQRKPFENRSRLNKSWQLAARVARLNGVTVENLPIPKSQVVTAPVITTPETKKAKATPPPPPTSGDVLADNAPKRRRSTRRKPNK